MGGSKKTCPPLHLVLVLATGNVLVHLNAQQPQSHVSFSAGIQSFEHPEVSCQLCTCNAYCVHETASSQLSQCLPPFVTCGWAMPVARRGVFLRQSFYLLLTSFPCCGEDFPTSLIRKAGRPASRPEFGPSIRDSFRLRGTPCRAGSDGLK